MGGGEEWGRSWLRMLREASLRKEHWALSIEQRPLSQEGVNYRVLLPPSLSTAPLLPVHTALPPQDCVFCLVHWWSLQHGLAVDESVGDWARDRTQQDDRPRGGREPVWERGVTGKTVGKGFVWEDLDTAVPGCSQHLDKLESRGWMSLLWKGWELRMMA